MKLVQRKMKTIRLAFNAHTGDITVSAPMQVSEAKVIQFIQPKLPWIEKHVALYEARGKQPKYEYLSGEMHYLEGQLYQLIVIDNSPINRISIKAGNNIEFQVVTGSSSFQREIMFYNWYRARLAPRVAPLLEKWTAIMGVQVTKWSIKRMKSRWGSCNTKKGNICINLELAKKPDHLLEYLVVHELAHLLEASHNSVFKAVMDRFLPDWRIRKAELNARHSG